MSTRCCRSGCELDGKWLLTVRLWAQGYAKRSHSPIVMQTELLVCDEHTKDAGRASDFFPQETRDRIALALRMNGRAPANFDTAEFHFEPITPAIAEALAKSGVAGLVSVAPSITKENLQ